MNRLQQNILLRTRNLVKVYRSGPSIIKVLKGINLTVHKGEVVVIMGPSGVGKSTLLNIIGTLDRPTEGEVWIEGVSMFEQNDEKLAEFRNRHIGFVFQFHYLLPEFTALENVLIPRMIQGNDWKKEVDRAVALLKEVGLGDRLHHRPNQLSGGEQQRVAMARALMNQPKLVLADEPTGDLDQMNSEALFDLILSLNAKFQQTFLIVTHNEMFARKASRVIHLWDGKIVDEKVMVSHKDRSPQ